MDRPVTMISMKVLVIRIQLSKKLWSGRGPVTAYVCFYIIRVFCKCIKNTTVIYYLFRYNGSSRSVCWRSYATVIKVSTICIKFASNHQYWLSNDRSEWLSATPEMKSQLAESMHSTRNLISEVARSLAFSRKLCVPFSDRHNFYLELGASFHHNWQVVTGL